jgi:hypothetical protein
MSLASTEVEIKPDSTSDQTTTDAPAAAPLQSASSSSESPAVLRARAGVLRLDRVDETTTLEGDERVELTHELVAELKKHGGRSELIELCEGLLHDAEHGFDVSRQTAHASQ